jgi:hypothetical protein
MAATAKGTANRTQVEATLAEIRHFYQAGRKSLEMRARGQRAEELSLQQEAAKVGLHPSRLFKARRMADPHDGYSQDELDALSAGVRRSASRFEQRGTAFTLTHLVRLLDVPKAAGRRSRIQKQLLRQGWSVSEFDSAVLLRSDRRTHVGRRPRIGADRAAVLLQIVRHCESWKRFCDDLARTPDKRKPFDIADLSAGIRARLKAAVAAVESLRAECEKVRSRSIRPDHA